MRAYAIRVSESARRSLLTLSDASFARVSSSIERLKTMSQLGRSYEPVYDAARPPFSCRVLYAGHFGLYYTVDEGAHEVYLRYVEDQRMNPRTRFKGRLGPDE